MSVRTFGVILAGISGLMLGVTDGYVTEAAADVERPTVSFVGATLADSSVTVLPDAELTDTLLTNTTDTAVFTALYENADEGGGDERQFDLSCQASGGSCSIIGPDEITLVRNGIPVGVGDTIEVEFTTPSTASSLWHVTLTGTAKEGSLSDSGSRGYRVDLPMDVSPNSIPGSVAQYSEATATFDVENTTGSSLQYSISCSWGGSSTCTPSPASPTIAAGSDTTITASFDAGPVTDDYELSLTASALGASDTATDTITVHAYGAVNVVADEETVYGEPSVTDTATFSVRVPGQAASSFAMTVTCGALDCSVLPADDTMSVGDTPTTVRVSHDAGSNGDTTVVTLTATMVDDSSVTASGDMTLVATSDVLLDVEGANPGMELKRGDCPNIAVGAGAIVCDDFQYVYQFTPVTRMNRTRQLSLVHNSSVGAPQGRVHMDFVLPPGGTLPDTIRARLRVAGNNITDFSGPSITWQAYPSSTWMGQSYTLGEKHRISFPWEWHNVPGNPQVHDVEVIFVQVFNGSGTQADTVSGYTTSLDRRWTIASGWWMGGWEYINPDTHPTTGDPVLVWHSGDLSTRVYEREINGTDTVYVGWTRARQDTIEVQGNNYVRKLLGGGEAHFNAWGFHTMTVRPTNDTTFFGTGWIGCCTRPTSVSVSTPSGRDTIYALDYDSIGLLEGVRVVGASGGWDTFDIVADTFDHSGSEFYIESITDPSGATTTFSQLPNWEGKPGYPLGKIVSPAGDTTNVGYLWDGSVGGVDTVRIQANASGGSPAVDIVMPYTAAARIGMYSWDPDMTTRLTSRVYSKLDGPDTVSTDTTTFYLTGHGAVRGIGDALGSTTWIDREDPDYPALPTRVRHPNGWEMEARYNAIGLPDTVIDRSNGAVTTYEWDSKWRKPTKVTSPEEVVTVFRYDAATGVRLRQAVDGDSVRFHYSTGGLLDSLVTPEGVKQALEYDTEFGNLQETVESDSVWTRYERDDVGRAVEIRRPISDGDSLTQTIAYDVMGRDSVTEISNSDDLYSQRTETYHDSAGRRTKVIPIGGYNMTLPDTGVISRWEYDNLSRVILERSVGRDSLVYDLAGNVIERYTARGDTVLNTYDVLNRRTSRWSSAITYAPGSGAIDTFPVHSPSGLTVDSMTTVFWYDEMAQLDSASNAVAKVYRSYTPNGLLLSDSLTMVRYDTGAFGLHGYMLRHEYDQDGRRVALHHPSWLSGGTDMTRYTYDSKGLIASITGPLGEVFSFTYDQDGRALQKEFPGSGVDSVRYDVLSRVTRRSIHANSEEFLSDSVTWSVRDKILREVQTADMRYNGLGQLDSMYTSPPSGTINHEFFEHNGLANLTRKYQLTNEGPDEYFSRWDHSYYPDGRLQRRDEVWNRDEPATAPDDWEPGAFEQTYDGAGNVQYTIDSTHAWSITETSPGFWEADKLTTHRSESRSYFDALGQLRYHQVNRDSLNNIGQWDGNWGVWEEYWYDPLGRRILKRSRQDSPHCEVTTRCRSSIDRFVWDGEQLLWELRQPNAGDAQNPSGGDYTGEIGYVHAGEIDGPLSMQRNGGAIVLHRNWRGSYAFGTNDNGEQVGCHPNFSQGCTPISWPANSWYAFHNKDERETPLWYGSLIAEHADATGLLYRRNRYYDPETGQFTQVDPIGIAGGLNLYGYAEGDPVNLSDPFGLTVCFGDGDESLIGATEWALDAQIEVDASGCVHDALDFGDDPSELQIAFNELVTSTDTYTVQFGSTSCVNASSHYCPSDRTVGVFSSDIGRRYPARGWTGGNCVVQTLFGSRMSEDLSSIIVHELLGHGGAQNAGGDVYSERRARGMENLYHRSHGLKERCGG